MLAGLISRIRRGQAPSPAAHGLTPGEVLDAAIAERRQRRMALPARTEAKRFAAARPKVEQLRHDIAMQVKPL